MDIRGYIPMFLLRRIMSKYDGKLKQIIVVRTDLNMRRGKEIAQGAHASMAATLNAMRSPFVRLWLDGSFTKVAVGVGSEQELLDLMVDAVAAGLPHGLIRDSGKTEFHGVPTHTALAIGPGDPELVSKITSHLKLR